MTKGTLTRAQADTLEQRLTANGPTVDLFEEFHGGPGQAPGIGPHGPALGGIDVLEAEAKALNMTPSALTAQLQSGKTLADIAKAQNVDQAVVKQAIIDAAKAQIQREVQDGLITQAQADQKLSTLTPDQIDLTRFSGFHGFGPGPRGSGKMPGSFWPGSF